MKQFHELTEAEIAELEKTQLERATAKSRELLQDVVCTYVPMEIKDISELDKIMTDEQKARAKADFEKYHPPGTPEIMCTSQDPEDGDGSKYLILVDVESWDE